MHVSSVIKKIFERSNITKRKENTEPGHALLGNAHKHNGTLPVVCPGEKRAIFILFVD